jgi:DNA-binding winged helix-turn-helix (wHTH) protein
MTDKAIGKRQTTLTNTARFRFGEFEFDPDTDVLTQKGRAVSLQAQPSTLLKILLIRSNQVVSREELKKAIWQDGTHVDFEKGLNFCVGQVRAALQDDAFRPLYVRTIPKRGYQFVAPVQVVDHDPGLRQVAPARAASRAGWIPLALAALGLAGIALFAGIFLSRERSAGSEPRSHPLRCRR